MNKKDRQLLAGLALSYKDEQDRNRRTQESIAKQSAEYQAKADEARINAMDRADISIGEYKKLLSEVESLREYRDKLVALTMKFVKPIENVTSDEFFVNKFFNLKFDVIALSPTDEFGLKNKNEVKLIVTLTKTPKIIYE